MRRIRALFPTNESALFCPTNEGALFRPTNEGTLVDSIVNSRFLSLLVCNWKMATQNFTVWESQNLVIWGLVHIPFEMMQLGDNSRITTEWGKLETAKKILESGGWNQTDPFRWRMLNQEDQERL